MCKMCEGSGHERCSPEDSFDVVLFQQCSKKHSTTWAGPLDWSPMSLHCEHYLQVHLTCRSVQLCVPFNADSENNTPLLATIPTGWPYSLPKPVTRVAPYCFLNSSNLEPSRSLAKTALTSQGFLGSAGTTPMQGSKRSCHAPSTEPSAN